MAKNSAGVSDGHLLELRVSKIAKILLAFLIGLSIIPGAGPAYANEPCAYYGTIYDGTPYARYFGTVCGQANIDATWPQVEAHMNANRAAYEAHVTAQAAEQAARAAAEEAARQAAAAAADAANCADAATLYPGTQWQRVFPAVCTAAAIQARSEEIRIYSENVVTLQASQTPTDQPSPQNFDCNLEQWRDTAFCINQGTSQNPNVNSPPLTNPDGSLNCANPINANAPICTGTIPDSQNCALPQNAALPFCTNNLPMTNPDGSINCAQPQNAITTTCMDLFKASSSGQLDCSRPELISMPICVIGSSTNNAAPAPSAPMQSPDLGLPSPTMGVAPQPTVPVKVPTSSAPGNSEKSSEKISQNKDELFAEEDGEEEPPAGTLEVSYSAPTSRYVVKVECNLAGEKLTVRAVKKGAKALRFTISIDEDGVGGVRTKSKLAGYTLTLYYGNTKLDQVRVK